MNVGMNFRVLSSAGKFLTGCENVKISRKGYTDMASLNGGDTF